MTTAIYASVSRDGIPIHLKRAPKTPGDRAHRKQHQHLDAHVTVAGIDAPYEELRSRGACFSGPTPDPTASARG